MNEKIQKLKEYASRRPHGTRAKYVSGCRCGECRKANSDYQRERDARKRRGEEQDPVVDVEPALRHMKALSKNGVGYKSVSEYSGVGKTTLFRILTGEKTHIRKSRLDAILAVHRGCFSAGSLIKAGDTWRRINWMLDEGFTKAEIARRLGAKGRGLQIRKKKVTGRTAVKVERLERILRMGE